MKPSRAPVRSLWLASLLGVAGCVSPRFAGPQIQEPPEGFVWDAGASRAETLFQEPAPVERGAWVQGMGDTRSALFVTHYQGPTTRAEVEAARDGRAEGAGLQIDLGPMEVLEIDGREAWGWSEHRRQGDALLSVEYRAVVPYDTATFVVEFWSNDPGWMLEPPLRAAVMTFAVGRAQLSWPRLFLALLAGLLVVRWMQRRAERRRRPMVIHDIKLPLKTDEAMPSGPRDRRGSTGTEMPSGEGGACSNPGSEAGEPEPDPGD